MGSGASKILYDYGIYKLHLEYTGRNDHTTYFRCIRDIAAGAKLSSEQGLGPCGCGREEAGINPAKKLSVSSWARVIKRS